MTAIQPAAGLKPDLLPGLSLIAYSTCLGFGKNKWGKRKWFSTLSWVLYGRGTYMRELVVPVSNLSHHFCLSGSPFCFLLSVFPGFPSQHHSSLLGTPVTNSCYWYLKLMVLVNAAVVLLFCNYPCPECWPLEIPVFIKILLRTLWKVSNFSKTNKSCLNHTKTEL